VQALRQSRIVPFTSRFNLTGPPASPRQPRGAASLSQREAREQPAALSLTIFDCDVTRSRKIHIDALRAIRAGSRRAIPGCANQRFLARHELHNENSLNTVIQRTCLRTGAGGNSGFMASPLAAMHCTSSSHRIMCRRTGPSAQIAQAPVTPGALELFYGRRR
jgi:hypothetical protein